MSEMHNVTSFYAFFPICTKELPRLGEKLKASAALLQISGLVLLGDEGINATVSGAKESIINFKNFVRRIFSDQTLEFKNSVSAKKPFKRFKLEIRPEIVTAGRPDLKPWKFRAEHLDPALWQHALEQDPEAIVIDTRNLYETKVGKFEGALIPQINHFSDFVCEFKKWNLQREKKLLIYCTGGIRCEKAALQLAELGYEKVYQLSGGILKYLENFPNRDFAGECFVFDHRVSLDQNLEPSEIYSLCPHCGNPASERIECAQCAKSAQVCIECLSAPERATCSKNCEHHFKLKQSPV